MNKNVTEEQFNNFMAENGMDYEVKTMNIPDPFTGEASRFHATYRTDNNHVFQMGLSKNFTPIQNKDSMGVIRDLSNVTELEMVNGGVWGGGAGLYAQISLGDMEIGKNGDKIGKYLSVVNSHDGSKAMHVLITPFRYWCKNQISPSLADARNATKDRFITIRHTASADTKIEEMVKTISIADGAFQRTQEIYQKLADTKINAEYVKETLEKLFPLNPEAGKRGITMWENTQTAIKERFNDADYGRTEVNTAWNLYNAIQGTIQHDGKNTSNKTRSVLMGSIADRSAKALTCVLDTCSSEHIPQSVMNEIEGMTA